MLTLDYIYRALTLIHISSKQCLEKPSKDSRNSTEFLSRLTFHQSFQVPSLGWLQIVGFAGIVELNVSLLALVLAIDG